MARKSDNKDIIDELREMTQAILAPNMQNKILGATEAIWDKKDFLNSDDFKDLIEACENRDEDSAILTIFIAADELKDLSKLSMLPLPVKVLDKESVSYTTLGSDSHGNFKTLVTPISDPHDTYGYGEGKLSDYVKGAALAFEWFPFEKGSEKDLHSIEVPAMEFVDELVKGLNKIEGAKQKPKYVEDDFWIEFDKVVATGKKSNVIEFIKKAYNDADGKLIISAFKAVDGNTGNQIYLNIPVESKVNMDGVPLIKAESKRMYIFFTTRTKAESNPDGFPVGPLPFKAVLDNLIDNIESRNIECICINPNMPDSIRIKMTDLRKAVRNG